MTQRNIHSQAAPTPSNDVVAASSRALQFLPINVALATTLLLVLVLIITSHSGAGVGFV